MKRDAIVGHRIAAVLQTPWKSMDGPEMTGIAGPVWHYTEFLLKLDNDTLVSMGCLSLELCDVKPPLLTEVDHGKSVVGRSVVQVLRDAPSWHKADSRNPDFPPLVCLEDGTYVCDSYLPGGNRFEINRFDSWEPEEVTHLVDYWEGTSFRIPAEWRR